MACSHVAHDCVLGDHIILANNVLLAGHVIVEDGAILNGAAAVQQFTTIGRLAYVGGLTRIVQDVPPFMVVEGNPAKVWKANIVGLQRNGYSEDQIAALRDAHRVIFRSKQPRAEILGRDRRRTGPMTPEVGELVAFLEARWSAGRSAALATADEGRRAVLDVAVVGAGHLGKIHARVLSEIPGVRLAAVVDTDPAAARAVAARAQVRRRSRTSRASRRASRPRSSRRRRSRTMPSRPRCSIAASPAWSRSRSPRRSRRRGTSSTARGARGCR